MRLFKGVTWVGWMTIEGAERGDAPEKRRRPWGRLLGSPVMVRAFI
ncbi:MAG TPA: hypothetical protein VJM57_03690 [Thermodesulfobacteriota bacterium]|nr:hypothetical protein [Thermodesulfobacteriota bacterium]